MDSDISPNQMDIDEDIKEEKISRKRKLCEIISSMNGSRKRKCMKHIIILNP